jgi:hypothetical protein
MKPDKIYLSLTLLLLLTALSWVTSCTHNADITDLPEICFTGEILPIFQNNCAISGCHSGGGESHMSLNTYADISKEVVAGNPDKSNIYQAIINKWGSQMPPSQPLSLENRTKIRLWIEQGAILTTCTDTTGNGDTISTYVARACFTRDILPVIVSRCATSGCHDATTHREGYNLTAYTNIRSIVTAGNPGASKLYEVITSSGDDSKMPPSGSPQLTVAEIDSINKWIEYGALNETCGEICDTTNTVTFSGTLWPLIQSTCTGCHSGSSPSGSVLLTSYSDVATVASNGSLINALKGSGVTLMPPSGSLSSCRIRQFEIWINNGYSNN